MTRLVFAALLFAPLGTACDHRPAGVTFDGRALCVPEARTVDLGPGSQARAPDAVGACKTWPEQALVGDDVRRTCGPCGFVFDLGATRAARSSGRADACCYAVSSPPPPPRF